MRFMLLGCRVVLPILVAAAALAACESSDDEPVTNAAGAPAMGDGGRAGSGGASAGNGSHAGESAAGAPGAGGSGGVSAGGSAGEGGAGGADDAGSAGVAGEGQGGSGPVPPIEVAYVGTFLGGLSAAAVDPGSGAPQQLGETVAKNGFVVSIAVHSSQRFLYVARLQQRLDVYRLGADGALPAQPASSMITPATLNTLTLDPQGRFAYAAGGSIFGYSIDPDSGALASIGDPIVVGDEVQGGVTYLAADPTGRYVYVSNALGGGITGFEIDRTSGKLNVIPGSPFGATGVPGGHNVFGGAIAITPNGEFLYSAGFALNAFKIAAQGKLELVEGSPFTLDIQSDLDATNLAIDPKGKYLYATHFLGNNHILGFEIDPAKGSLSPLPGSPLTGIAPYSASVSPSGRFLYVGVDDAHGLDAYSIRPLDGSLKRIEGSPFAIGGLEPMIAFATLPSR